MTAENKYLEKIAASTAIAKAKSRALTTSKGIIAKHHPRSAAWQEMLSGRAKDAAKGGTPWGRRAVAGMAVGAAIGAAAHYSKKKAGEGQTKKASESNVFLEKIAESDMTVWNATKAATRGLAEGAVGKAIGHAIQGGPNPVTKLPSIMGKYVGLIHGAGRSLEKSVKK